MVADEVARIIAGALPNEAQAPRPASYAAIAEPLRLGDDELRSAARDARRVIQRDGRVSDPVRLFARCCVEVLAGARGAGERVELVRAETRSSQRRAAAWAWAATHLTDLDRAMVASTASSLRHRLGRWPTEAEIRNRLREQGRDHLRGELR